LAGGSYLRVSQLGFGWLVPDEQVDADYNPAMLNNIDGKRLFLAFSTEYRDFSKNTYDFFGVNTFLEMPFDKLKLAMRYKTLLTDEFGREAVESANINYNTITDDYEFKLFISYPVKYNIKVGFSGSITTYDYYFSQESDLNYFDSFQKIYSQNYQIKAGILFDINEFWGIGGSLETTFGEKKYIKSSLLKLADDNLSFALFIHPEFRVFKHDRNIIIRSFLSFYYDSVITKLRDLFLWLDEDESYYNLNAEMGVGLYYELQDKTAITCGIKYNQIFINKNKIYIVNKIDTIQYDGFDLSVFVGIEKPVFVDWVLIRAGYNIFTIKSFNYSSYREEGSFLVWKNFWNEKELLFMPELNNNITLGATVRFGENILFNVNFGKYFFYLSSYENKVRSLKTGFDVELNFIFE